MDDGQSSLDEVIQSSLQELMQQDGRLTELITKLALKPMQLTVLEIYVLAKVSKLPIDQFIVGLMDRWPEYSFLDELTDKMPEVLSYLNESAKGENSK